MWFQIKYKTILNLRCQEALNVCNLNLTFFKVDRILKNLCSDTIQ